MRKRWVLPLTILCLLIVAMLLRWETLSTSTVYNSTIKYRLDRWTGQTWVGVYNSRGVLQMKATDRKIDYLDLQRQQRDSDPDTLGAVWRIATGIAALWLIYDLIRYLRQPTDGVA